MDFEMWKGLHENDTGGQLLIMLIREAMEKGLDRQAATNHRYKPVAYWDHLENQHDKRIDWLAWKLTGILERKEGAADADGEGSVPGRLGTDRHGGEGGCQA